MQMKWTRLAIPLACAAVMGACGGSDGRRDERMPQLQQRPTSSVKLTGCVRTGPLETKYVLDNVRQEQPGGAQQQSGDPSTNGSTITEGSYVQLRTENDDQLRQHLGQRVEITGRMVDDGTSTIGTSGAEGQPTPSGDRSQAAATERDWSDRKRDEQGRAGRTSMANPTAAIVLVEQINPTGERCE